MIRRLVLALGLAGTTFASAGAVTPAGATAPLVGSCHRLTYAQAVNDSSDDAPAVPCTSAHTTQTVAAITSPTPFAGLTDDQVAQQAARLCDPAMRKAFGAATLREQTAYVAWDFTPNATQIAAGESWVRCDVGLVSGPALEQLPHHTLRLPLATRPISDDIRLCLEGRFFTTCNHRHTQRTVGAFKAPTKALPTKAAFNRYAQRRCPGATGYVFETAMDRYRVIVCYRKTRH